MDTTRIRHSFESVISINIPVAVVYRLEQAQKLA